MVSKSTFLRFKALPSSNDRDRARTASGVTIISGLGCLIRFPRATGVTSAIAGRDVLSVCPSSLLLLLPSRFARSGVVIALSDTGAGAGVGSCGDLDLRLSRFGIVGGLKIEGRGGAVRSCGDFDLRVLSLFGIMGGTNLGAEGTAPAREGFRMGWSEKPVAVILWVPAPRRRWAIFSSPGRDVSFGC